MMGLAERIAFLDDEYAARKSTRTSPTRTPVCAAVRARAA